MTRRWREWSKRHELGARSVLRVMCWTVVAVVLVAGVSIPVGQAYQSNRCEPAYWGDGHRLRNSIVYPGTEPTCDGGVWKVTTPRGDMPEDAYGFNCYMDGDGACGALEILDRDCMTDPGDGYTMCVDGEVYYREVSGAKLWPVVREPLRNKNGA